jgi:hypothetical protein
MEDGVMDLFWFLFKMPFLNILFFLGGGGDFWHALPVDVLVQM